MKLRTRLTLAFLACGVLPMLVAVAISYQSAHQGMVAIQKESAKELEQMAKNQLDAIRHQKQLQLERYVKLQEEIIVPFSCSQVARDAARDMVSAFKSFRQDNNVTPDELTTMRAELADYYGADFTDAFKKQTGGAVPDVASYLAKLDDDSIALQHQYIKQNPNPIGSKHLLPRGDDASTYSELHAKYHAAMRPYVEQFGYYDIFLIDPESGDIVYTVFKETDFTTSLKNGPNANTNLAACFKQAASVGAGKYAAADFAAYWPSYQAPAMFLAAPIYDGDTLLAVCAFQLPIDRMNSILTARDGMGETGETILIGPDYKMRSDSFRDPEKHSLAAAFKSADGGKVDTKATRAAFEKGEEGVVTCVDYVGHEALIHYGPVSLLGLKFCLNAKMDTSELFASIKTLDQMTQQVGKRTINSSVAVGAVALIAILGFALFISTRLSKPVVAAAAFCKEVAGGNLTQTCSLKAGGEVGTLIDSMNDMSTKLRDTVGKIRQNAQTVASSSTELSATATQLSSGAEQTTSQSATVAAAAEEMAINMNNMASAAEQMSSGVKGVSAAIEEMTASINEIAKNTEHAATAAGSAASLANVSNDKVAQLGSAADEIGKVVTVIQDIAEQTNLLALNATIEAARAGEAGKGFAVVASEVKELARQTASATEDIAKRISAIQSTTSESVKAIGEIVQAIASVNDVSATIAAAIEEQSATTKEIARSMSQTATAAETVSVGVAQSASASKEITRNISGVDQCAKQTACGAGETQQAGRRLSDLSEGLNSLVAQFQV
ncbi:MAG: methyl-accepting chemotaxis protein [Phycisphaerales bacterium]|nr:methyl-accepting chemotaxis protein [Phycisphaerales bacterium]